MLNEVYDFWNGADYVSIFYVLNSLWNMIGDGLVSDF
ncbi:hypothetical protein LSS_02519 [Leptospira santarosai serovar Shermani str. LT 821]|uniref:Uncharacterized protein n=1 Tax=Leptospira santarosai serovar Shermani str. LT 821 TaxID=758847 RepID=K8YFT0_9LEPT|nr:hypothetical protein LSS_02519 [Leptospira santarosai serovar Shermani str. LT 821]